MLPIELVLAEERRQALDSLYNSLPQKIVRDKLEEFYEKEDEECLPLQTIKAVRNYPVSRLGRAAKVVFRTKGI